MPVTWKRGTIKSDYIAVRNVANLRALRLSWGASLDMIAEHIGVSATYISHIERFPEECSPEVYAKLAELFNWEKFVFNRPKTVETPKNQQDLTLPLDFEQARNEDDATTKNNLNDTLHISIPHDMKSLLVSWADQHNRTVSDVVQEAVRRFFFAERIDT